MRGQATLRSVWPVSSFTSPRLGIRFDLSSGALRVYRPDGREFRSRLELAAENERNRQRAEQERLRAEEASRRAEQADQRAAQERQRADRAIEMLRALGLDPDR